MKRRSFLKNYSKKSIWHLALLAIISAVWLIVRTGTKPSRISYPCQKAAAANINLFLIVLAQILAGLTSKLLPERILRSRIAKIVMVTGLLVTMAISTFTMFTINADPVVNLTLVDLDLQSQTTTASSPSNLFIIQNASGLQGNMDAAISALLSSMQNQGLNFFDTTATPSGLI
jgi:hypothetical protein